MPTKKLGADWPTKAPNIANRSMMVLRFMAAMIPAGMPTMIAMASATLASSSVAGSRSMNSSVTGRL